MWTTLAMFAALSAAPADAGQLSLTNVRNTYGIQGPARTGSDFLPGDIYVLSFSIEGLKATDGKVQYGIALQVADSSGKVLFKQDPRDLEAKAPADGKGLPAYATIQIGLDQPPGDYTVNVNVKDRAAGTSEELTRKAKILPKGFGIVRVSASEEPGATRVTSRLEKGKPGWINFSVVGFGHGQGSDQPNLEVSMSVLDKDGNAALSKPSGGVIDKGVPPKAHAVPMQFGLELNKTGEFTVELKATDKTSGDTAKVSFPLAVKGK